jgi:hypothetical protein
MSTVLITVKHLKDDNEFVILQDSGTANCSCLNSFQYMTFDEQEKARRTAKACAFDEVLRLQEDHQVKVAYQF